MRKKEKRDTHSLNVFDLTTRELREEIRKRTSSVNARIAEYKKSVQEGVQKASAVIDKAINILKGATAAEKVISRKVDGKRKTIRTGEYVIPTSRTGEIGLGLSYKTKTQLQHQLASLRRFEEKDIYTPQGEKEWSDKVKKQYETFKTRYGDISKEDYENMIDTMNIVKNTLKDYGYEDFGGSYARIYVKTNQQGKDKFVAYIEKAKKEASGGTVEDILDKVAEYLRANNEI